MRILYYAAGLSLILAVPAQAQAPAAKPGQVNPPVSSAPAATPPAVDTSATTSPYKTGMVIKDAQGSTIGTIARVIRTPDGATTISANVDGRNVNLPASALTVSPDGGAVSSMSKAQITASTVPPT
jgi:hypothetical protein